MQTQAKILEEALALGFDSIEQCDEHQKWLKEFNDLSRRQIAAYYAGEVLPTK